MEYLSRSRLPVFTPRLDLTAEDLNSLAEVMCVALNELAGRVHIIKDMIPADERAQYAEELNYPILDEIERIAKDLENAWETIRKNKEECEAHYQDTLERIQELDTRLNELIQQVREELLEKINLVDTKHTEEEKRIENKFDNEMSDLEKRFNALDDAAARKADLATLIDRLEWIQTHSLPTVGENGNWLLGGIDTGIVARGEKGEPGAKGEPGYSGVYIGDETPPENANVWIYPDGPDTFVPKKSSDLELDNVYSKAEVDAMIGLINDQLEEIINGGV